MGNHRCEFPGHLQQTQFWAISIVTLPRPVNKKKSSTNTFILYEQIHLPYSHYTESRKTVGWGCSHAFSTVRIHGAFPLIRQLLLLLFNYHHTHLPTPDNSFLNILNQGIHKPFKRFTSSQWPNVKMEPLCEGPARVPRSPGRKRPHSYPEVCLQG